MKPLFSIVVAILVIATNAHPENIEAVKELPQSKEPVVEAEASEPQTRTERCTACGNTLSLKSPKELLAAIKSLPNAEVHTQQSFEGCSSEKGCAGIKYKDGKVVQKFGNLQAFNAAANADTGNEFQFQAAGNSVLEGGPYWWMNQNSPFKNGGGSGSYEKFSKSSSSFTSSSNGGAGGVDLAANPFLNGDFSKLAAGAGFNAAGGNFGAAGGNFGAAGGNFGAAGSKFGAAGGNFGAAGGNFAGAGGNAAGAGGNFAGSQSFESSSSSTKEIDISNNPFLNGGLQAGFSGQNQGQSGFGSNSQSGYEANSQNSFGSASNGFGSSQSGGQSSFGAFNAGSKFGSNGYTGSSPAPFSASTAGSNINLIQNTQKNSGYDFQQQQTQQSIDEAFQSTGNVQAHDNSGGNLQQTCAGQGYVCVLKSQCNNGVVNTNGGALLQANTQKQYCNTRNEICCRLETSSLAGAGSLQGSLGVGSATFSGASNQGSGVFSQSGSSQNSQTNRNTFGASSGFGSNQASGFNAVSRGTSGFGSTQSGVGSTSFGANKFGSTAATGFGSSATPSPSRFGSTGNFNNEVFKATSQSNFVETDSFSSGSENAGVYRPGAIGSGLRPGIPYLPPVDSSTSGSNVVSTAYTPAFVTTPRPIQTPRPFTTPKPTYLPPVQSTRAPEYLPPVDKFTAADSFLQNTYQNIPTTPNYVDGGILLDQFQPGPTRPKQPVLLNNEIPAGCAAALKCTPIEFCTAEGVISNTSIALTRDQEAYRVPLTDCKDLDSGRIGKCCRDPLYTDPWPTNQLGKWVPGVFGGNDGKYVPDSRGSPNTFQPGVSVRPPSTGGVILNSVLSTPKPNRGQNQVTPGYPSTTPGSFIQKTQFGLGGRGSYAQGGQGSFTQGGQGSFTQGGQGSFTQGSQGQIAVQGQGQYGLAGQGNQGAGSTYSQTTSSFGQEQTGQIGIVGQGTRVQQGQGSAVLQGGGGTSVSQGFGTGIRQGSGFGVTQGQGIGVSQGAGFGLTQNRGVGVTQGGGIGVTQGGGFEVTQGQGSVSRGQGFAVTGGQGQYTNRGQGQTVTQGSGFGVTSERGQGFSQGSGSVIRQGSGIGVSQGGGFGVSQGGGFSVSQGGGTGVSQGSGFGVRQGSGFEVSQGGGYTIGQGTGQSIFQGQGQKLIQGEGEEITQGLVTGVRKGSGYTVSQNGGFGYENEFGESIQRVYLPKYTGSGQCGVTNPQKPYGNPKDLEVDFAEIPWQAMVLLQTNRSLLCGGVITRPDVVITSASCVDGLQAKNVLIKGGEWKLGIDEEPLPFQIVQVKHILRHPLYKAGILTNDVAILVLTENLRLAKNIWPICLPSSSDTLDAFYNGAGECIVTGWGKTVLQAHLLGSVMNSINVSLLNPGECQAKINQDYPHLSENYDQDSCVCGQPTNPANNICKVDIGSALACTTGSNNYVLRGIYSWDSGCQVGNQLAAFYKFDLEWYEWAIGQIESVRFSQFTTTKITNNRITTQVSGVKSTFGSGIKGSSGIKGTINSGASAIAGSGVGIKGFGLEGQSQSGQFSQFGTTNFGTGSTKFTESGAFGTEIKSPIQKTFSATYTEKKFYQTEPKFVTYTTKPEIVTFTTKPEYFTYTTKPKIVRYTTKPEIVTYTTKPEIVTYTTKPQIIRYDYQTSGSQTSQQVVPPGVSFNPSFTEVVGAKHTHDAKCKCNKK